MKSLITTKRFIEDVLEEVQEKGLSDAAAALSFHTLLAIVPVLTLLILLLGMVWGRENIEILFFSLFEDTFGAEVEVLAGAVEGAFDMMTNFLFSVVILAVALWASVGLVHHVRKTFFALFNVEISARGGIARTLKSRAISFGYALLLFALIVIVMLGQGVLGFVFSVAKRWTGGVLPDAVLEVVSFVAMFCLIFVIFNTLFRLMSVGSLHWKSIVFGAALSSFLFVVFNLFLSLYIAYSITLGLFGASGFILVFLIWVYYSAYTLFLGGVVAAVVSRRLRRRSEQPVYI